MKKKNNNEEIERVWGIFEGIGALMFDLVWGFG